jgi:hypothetical protein
MNTIIIKKIEDGIQPPTGNPFPIFAHAIYTYQMSNAYIIDTGLEISIPSDHVLNIVGTPMLMASSWTIGGFRLPSSPTEWPKGRIIVVMCGSLVKEGTKVGDVYIVRQKISGIRFVQHTPEGGRIVRGDSQIANSAEN